MFSKLFVFVVITYQVCGSTIRQDIFADQLDDEFMHPPPQSENNRMKREDFNYGLNGFEKTGSYWKRGAQKKLKDQLLKDFNTNMANNVILFLGDGMSSSTVTASRIYMGQKNGQTGEESKLYFEDFPYIGVSKTYCVDKQTADSACSATAYLCGVKANYGTLGVNAKVTYNDCDASIQEKNHVNSIMKWAQDAGKATGIVTTTRITHASPAATYSHSANRNWESDADIKKLNLDPKKCPDIAQQLIRQEPGVNFNVILGGGRKKFLSENAIDEEGQKGQRLDGVDLIDEWIVKKSSEKAHYIYDKKGLLSLNYSNTEYVLGLFESDHMKFNLDADHDTEPTLSEMTKAAIEILKSNKNGYVLFVEGGRIDHAHHQNLAWKALDETAEFSEAVKTAGELTDEFDTLIAVTADHSHTMTISGYNKRGSSILGLNSETSNVDKWPYTTLSYANGPSYKQRYQMLDSEVNDKDYKYPSLLPLEDETHGGDDVQIYARGPFSHLFAGVIEQNVIPHVLAFASCLGDGLTTCNRKQ